MSRRGRGHPFLFLLTAGTFGAAVAHGDVAVAVLMLVAAVWLVIR